MRIVWATSSAAVFFLGETEAYLQGEVVKGTWIGFRKWLTGETVSRPTSPGSTGVEDIWLEAGKESKSNLGVSYTHDPQTLAVRRGEGCPDSERRISWSMLAVVYSTSVSCERELIRLFILGFARL